MSLVRLRKPALIVLSVLLALVATCLSPQPAALEAGEDTNALKAPSLVRIAGAEETTPAAESNTQADDSDYVDVIMDPLPGHARDSLRIQNPELRSNLETAEPVAQVAPGMTAYANMETMVVIYPNTAGGTLTPHQIESLKQQSKDTASFIWRHSHFKMHLNLTFLVIDTYKDLSEFTGNASDGYWLSPTDNDGDGSSVEDDLLARGYRPGQFGSINYQWAHNSGALPLAYGGLGGMICWKLGCTGITGNPIFDAAYVRDGLSNALPHEMQHALDALLDASGHPEYFFADRPWFLQGDFGSGWSFWVRGMAGFPYENWLDMSAPWATTIQTPDQDADGVPDEGATLILSESTFGSMASSKDTDSDGLRDMAEATAGILKTSEPNNPDTDDDGRLDGNDSEPLYDFTTLVPERTLPLDGNPAGWTRLTSHMEYMTSPISVTVYSNADSDYLYFMFTLDRYAGILMQLDTNGDGWFHGKDNYEIVIDPSFGGSVNRAEVWDASDELIAWNTFPMMDSDPNYPGGRLVTPESLGIYARDYGSGFLAQLAIPRNEKTSLIPHTGQRMGLRLLFDYIDRDPARYAEMFESEDFAYYSLWGEPPTISGQVAYADGSPMSDITVSDSWGHSTATDTSGKYILSGLSAGTYTLTPSKSGHTFSPSTRSVTVPPDATGQDFAGTLPDRVYVPLALRNR